MADTTRRQNDSPLPWLVEKEGQVWTAEDTKRILRLFRTVEADWKAVATMAVAAGSCGPRAPRTTPKLRS